jgi:hypothetical protein
LREEFDSAPAASVKTGCLREKLHDAGKGCGGTERPVCERLDLLHRCDGRGKFVLSRTGLSRRDSLQCLLLGFLVGDAFLDLPLLRSASPGFLSLPWELLQDPQRPTPLALELSAIDRTLVAAGAAAAVPPGPELRVLMVIARPTR